MKTLYAWLILNLFNYSDSETQNDTKSTRTRTPVSARVIGGALANIQDFPAVACLILKTHAVDDFRGGATIVNENWAVTAAHCMTYISEDDIANKLAYVRSNSATWCKGFTDHLIIKGYTHEQYNYNTTDYDIAVLKVKDPFKGANEKPAKFAKLNFEYTDDSPVIVLGWGTTDATAQEPFVVPDLRLVTVNLIGFETCKSVYRDVNEIITERMICANAPEKDACVYDSGGPLFQGDILIGIVSWGSPKCADKTYPGVYTRIALFHQWIRRRITEKAK